MERLFAWSSIASAGNVVDAVDEVTEDTWKEMSAFNNSLVDKEC